MKRLSNEDLGANFANLIRKVGKKTYNCLSSLRGRFWGLFLLIILLVTYTFLFHANGFLFQQKLKSRANLFLTLESKLESKEKQKQKLEIVWPLRQDKLDLNVLVVFQTLKVQAQEDEADNTNTSDANQNDRQSDSNNTQNKTNRGPLGGLGGASTDVSSAEGVLSFSQCRFGRGDASGNLQGCLRQLLTFSFVVGIFLIAMRIAIEAFKSLNPTVNGDAVRNSINLVKDIFIGLVLIGAPGIFISTFNPAALNLNMFDLLGDLGQRTLRSQKGDNNSNGNASSDGLFGGGEKNGGNNQNNSENDSDGSTWEVVYNGDGTYTISKGGLPFADITIQPGTGGLLVDIPGPGDLQGKYVLNEKTIAGAIETLNSTTAMPADIAEAKKLLEVANRLSEIYKQTQGRLPAGGQNSQNLQNLATVFGKLGKLTESIDLKNNSSSIINLPLTINEVKMSVLSQYRIPGKSNLNYYVVELTVPNSSKNLSLNLVFEDRVSQGCASLIAQKRLPVGTNLNSNSNCQISRLGLPEHTNPELNKIINLIWGSNASNNF